VSRNSSQTKQMTCLTLMIYVLLIMNSIAIVKSTIDSLS